MHDHILHELTEMCKKGVEVNFSSALFRSLRIYIKSTNSCSLSNKVQYFIKHEVETE